LFNLIKNTYIYGTHVRLSGIDKNDVKQIRVGVCAIVWALWNARNDHVFNKPKALSFFQVIPMATYWIRTWSYLQTVEQRDAMDSGCNRLETVARDIFNHLAGGVITPYFEEKKV
jgi:hypothetical protein